MIIVINCHIISIFPYPRKGIAHHSSYLCCFQHFNIIFRISGSYGVFDRYSQILAHPFYGKAFGYSLYMEISFYCFAENISGCLSRNSFSINGLFMKGIINLPAIKCNYVTAFFYKSCLLRTCKSAGKWTSCCDNNLMSCCVFYLSVIFRYFSITLRFRFSPITITTS